MGLGSFFINKKSFPHHMMSFAVGRICSQASLESDIGRLMTYSQYKISGHQNRLHDHMLWRPSINLKQEHQGLLFLCVYFAFCLDFPSNSELQLQSAAVLLIPNPPLLCLLRCKIALIWYQNKTNLTSIRYCRKQTISYFNLRVLNTSPRTDSIMKW